MLFLAVEKVENRLGFDKVIAEIQDHPILRQSVRDTIAGECLWIISVVLNAAIMQAWQNSSYLSRSHCAMAASTLVLSNDVISTIFRVDQQ